MTEATTPARPLIAGKIGVTLLCIYLVAVAVRVDGCYGPEPQSRDELPDAGPLVGQPFPAFTLRDVSGARVTSRDLAGRAAVLAFVPTLDWSPPSKARVLELAERVVGRQDVRLAVVLTAAAATPRSRVFVREHETPAYFLVDDVGLTQSLGLEVAAPDGTAVALPATFVVDASGTVLLRDVRRNARRWLDADTVVAAATIVRSANQDDAAMPPHTIALSPRRAP